MTYYSCMGGAKSNADDLSVYDREASIPLPVRNDILRLKPHDLKASEPMIRSIEAHVAAPPKSTLRSIAEAAGVPEQTIRGWLYNKKGYGRWLLDVLMTMGVRCVPRVWAAMMVQALNGDATCARMVLMRFDPGFREIMGKPIAKSLKPPSIDPGTLRRADAIIEQQDKESVTKQGKEAEGGMGGDGGE